MTKISLEVTAEQLMKIAMLLSETTTTPTVAPVQQIPPAPAPPRQTAPAIPAAQPAPPMSPAAPVIPTAQPPALTVQQMFPPPAPQQEAPTPAQPAIPAQTAPQTYTVQELSLAARPLMEMGRQQDLMNLLAEFSAPSVAELPENQRAAFAAKLRAMGGQI